MANVERREIINLLKDYYQFLCGTWSEKAEQDLMQRLRDDIERLEKLDERHECCGMPKNNLEMK